MRSLFASSSLLANVAISNARHLSTTSARRTRISTPSSIVVNKDSVYVPSLHTSFSHIWLRDSCQCPVCVHPSTRQKLHTSSDFANGITPSSVEAREDVLHVKWDSQHTSSYPIDFLKRYSSPIALSAYRKDVTPRPWKADLFANEAMDAILVPYTHLSRPDVLLSVYTRLLKYGLVFFKDVPTRETSNERCELRTLAEKLGEIRKTFYGETWNVRNIRNSKNIAYTNLNLGLHMDLLYFKEPPRYQVLHCLRNRVRGGQSIFVDALQAANELRSTHPEAYTLLTQTPVPFHYINDGHHLHHSHPTLELSTPTSSSTSSSSSKEQANGTALHVLDHDPVLRSVNYSPPFQAPLPASTPLEFFRALAAFSERLNDPANCFSYLLREGDAVLFDNRRVLHGRAAFQDGDSGDDREVNEDNEGNDNGRGYGTKAGGEGEGERDDTNRWLKGCYLEEDPVYDRMRILAAATATATTAEMK